MGGILRRGDKQQIYGRRCHQMRLFFLFSPWEGSVCTPVPQSVYLLIWSQAKYQASLLSIYCPPNTQEGKRIRYIDHRARRLSMPQPLLVLVPRPGTSILKHVSSIRSLQGSHYWLFPLAFNFLGKFGDLRNTVYTIHCLTKTKLQTKTKKCEKYHTQHARSPQRMLLALAQGLLVLL